MMRAWRRSPRRPGRRWRLAFWLALAAAVGLALLLAA
jgi:hypothetical protein